MQHLLGCADGAGGVAMQPQVLLRVSRGMEVKIRFTDGTRCEKVSSLQRTDPSIQRDDDGFEV